MRKLYAMWMLVCFSVAQLNAQESNKGQLTGRLESNSIYYVEDTGLDAARSIIYSLLCSGCSEKWWMCCFPSISFSAKT